MRDQDQSEGAAGSLSASAPGPLSSTAATTASGISSLGATAEVKTATAAGAGTSDAGASSGTGVRSPRARRRGQVTVPSVAAGVLVALSVPPWGWWPLAFAGTALLCWRLRGLRARARFAAGWAFGLGLFVPGLWWALSFNVYGGVVLMLAEALAPALAALATPPRHGRLLALPAAMVLAEWLRDTVPFGGLPMGSMALGQASGPLAVVARLGGPLLLVGVTWLVGTGLAALAETAVAAWASRRPEPPADRVPGADAMANLGGEVRGGVPGADAMANLNGERRGRGRVPAAGRRLAVTLPAAGVAALAVAVAITATAGLSPDGGPNAGTLRVAAVQGGGRRGVSQAQVSPATVFAAQLAATAAVPAHDAGRPPALVVWPEDVVALPGHLAGSPERSVLQATARGLRATMVVGVTEDVGATRFRNEAVTLAPSGAVLGSYEKVHRVPFGEYVPDRSFFSHLANLSAVPRDAIPGHGDGILTTPAPRLGTMISFEVFFAGRGRDPVRHGADLLVVPTNTSSYTTSQVPSQEVAADRLQAIAEGRYLVQAAPTGYSDVVAPNGSVLDRSPLGRRSVIVADVHLRHGLTMFARAGSLPAQLAAIAALAAAWVMVAWAGSKRRRRSVGRPHRGNGTPPAADVR